MRGAKVAASRPHAQIWKAGAMQILNVQGRMDADFASFALSQLESLIDQGTLGDYLIIVPNSESRRQLIKLAQTDYPQCPLLKKTRVATPELIARALLKEGGSAPRLVATGELSYIIGHLAKSGISAHDAAKAIGALSARMGEIPPRQLEPKGTEGEADIALEDFFAKHDLALWNHLPSLAQLRKDAASFAGGAYGARTVYALDAQDLSPAALSLSASLAQERLILCDAPDAACEPEAKLRRGEKPLSFAQEAITLLGRSCETENVLLEQTNPKPRAARVVWENVEEEISGIAAYVWKLLRENPDLEAQQIGIIAPSDKWLVAMGDDLTANNVGVSLLPARNPLCQAPRFPQVRDEHVAYLRLRQAANPEDEFARLELGRIGNAASDEHIVKNLRDSSGFSIAKFACRGLKAPFVSEILSKHSWDNVSHALEGVEARVLDPSFEAGPHDVRILTPERAASFRGRVIIAAGLSHELSPRVRSTSALRALQKAAALAETVILSRPRAATAKLAQDWGLETERSVTRSAGTNAILSPSTAFEGLQTDIGAPLIGEQLLSGRL